jgi:hypothetical protein
MQHEGRSYASISNTSRNSYPNVPHICASSKFFEKVCSDEHKTECDSTIKLLNISSKSFEIYLKWLYSGRFYIVEDNDVTTDTNVKSDTSSDAE